MGTVTKNKVSKITVTLDELREIGLDEDQLDQLILADKKRDEAEPGEADGTSTDEQDEMQASMDFANGGGEG